jgi:hypothetical protein
MAMPLSSMVSVGKAGGVKDCVSLVKGCEVTFGCVHELTQKTTRRIPTVWIIRKDIILRRHIVSCISCVSSPLHQPIYRRLQGQNQSDCTAYVLMIDTYHF